VGVALGGTTVSVGVALGDLVGLNVGLAVGEETNVLRGRLHNMDMARGVAPAAINLKNLRLFIDCSFLHIYKIYDL